MFKTTLALVFLTLASAVSAATLSAQDSKSLLQAEEYLNDKCRGGSGDSSDTLKACAVRDKIVIVLSNNGWCYGEKGQYEYQMKWHKCK